MLNEIDKGYICFIISFLLIILTSINVYFFPFTATLSYDHLLGFMLYFWSVVSALIGYFYIHGDPDRDFWLIALTSIGLFLVMDLGVINNLIEYVNSLI